VGNVYIILKQIHSGKDYQISSELKEFYGRYYKKRYGLFFLGHSVHSSVSQSRVGATLHCCT